MASAPSAAARDPHDWDPAPKITYGKGLLGKLDGGDALLKQPLVFGQPEPLKLLEGDAFGEGSNAVVSLVTEIDHSSIKATAARLRAAHPQASAVFGVGGGMALDAAKFVACELQMPLVLMPTILSVDAGYTRAIGVRTDGKVHYVGNAAPFLKAILIDFAILTQAPPVLNRAGAGDILSCFTALWDWKKSSELTGEDYDGGVATTVEEKCLAPLYKDAGELNKQTEAGLKLLSDLFAEEVRICELWGNARPEEGSEHYVAYALEAKTGKHYIHGQLIGACVLMTATYQGQDVGRVVRCLQEIGLDCSFSSNQTSREEMSEVLSSMGDYVLQETQLLPGVFHFKGSPSEADIQRMLDAVDSVDWPTSE